MGDYTERKEAKDELKKLVSGHRRRLQQIKEGVESWNDEVSVFGFVHDISVFGYRVPLFAEINWVNTYQLLFILVHFISFVCHFAFVYRDVYDSDYKTVLYFLQGE